ncbi:hypothetical protein NQ314_001960 [Rhamnusium bicolor]|uniref:Uncharacterized protein n=1 Tax=Rhamnusium bicolor TaxID=1586634 RepID=A0AAV8ZU83_9CUCU|nr:hypothetical protein NQ314_001960 [Rhamnusium bicolor]
MCNEATKLMSTLQMSAIPSATADPSLFKDYSHQGNPYSCMQPSLFPQPFDIPDNKGSIGKFCTR